MEEAGLQLLSRYGSGTSYSNTSSGLHRIIVTVNQATDVFTNFIEKYYEKRAANCRVDLLIHLFLGETKRRDGGCVGSPWSGKGAGRCLEASQATEDVMLNFETKIFKAMARNVPRFFAST